MIRLVFIFLALFTGSVTAQTIITDRPDQTESSSTIPKGSLQLESGFLIGFTEDNTQTERQILAPTTLFRYGITKWMELRFLSQIESVKSQLFQKEEPGNTKEIFGISDLEIGTKIQLFRKENVNTEIAFLSHLITPTGSKALSNNSFGTINQLSISHKINKRIGVGYNLGYNYFGTGKGDLTYSLALGIAVTEKISIYVEPYGDLIEFSTFIANADAGVTYLLRDNFQLDFSFGTGLNHRMNYVSIGFSWNIAEKQESTNMDEVIIQ